MCLLHVCAGVSTSCLFRYCFRPEERVTSCTVSSKVMSQITWLLGPLEEQIKLLTRRRLSNISLNISENLSFEWNFFQTFGSIHFYYVYGFPHDVCMCTMCVLGGFGQQERLADPLELELQLVLSHSVSAKI